MITTCSIEQAHSDPPQSQRATPVAVNGGVEAIGGVEGDFKGLATGVIGVAVAVTVGAAVFTTSGVGVEVGLETGRTSGISPIGLEAVDHSVTAGDSGARMGPVQPVPSNRISPITRVTRNPPFFIKIIFKTKRGASMAPQP
jgi:hypothetical protein